MTRIIAHTVLLAAAAGCTVGFASISFGVTRIAVDQATAVGEVRGTSIYLQTGEIDTNAKGVGGDRGSLVALMNDQAGRLGARHFVIQCEGAIRPEWRERLKAAGVEVGDYLPMNALIVRLDQADAGQVANLEFVRWYSEYQPAWKIAPGIGARFYNTPERAELAAAGGAVVIVNLFHGEPARGVIDAISAIPGAQVHWVEELAGSQMISATLNRVDVPKLGAIAAVQWVEEAPDVDVRNDTNRWIVQTNVANMTPMYTAGIRGEGQILGLLDTRLDRNHCSFRDASNPVGPLHRKVLAYNASAGAEFHGTHVAGTAMGDNGDNTSTRGIAYNAKVVFNTIPAFNETSMVTACNTHHNQGARIHTNSWGDDGTTAYNSLCRGVDVFSFNNEEDLILFAVTNTGSLKNPENAKNLVAVGATQDNPNQGNHCSGGSGPTSDQRRKPEIYAPGCSTVSANAGSACGTTTATGTSMACPAVAGSAMLVRQYFVDGYFPSGVATSSDGFTPTGALIKATLLNSAVNMTGPAGYPSNQEGWGRVLLDNSIYLQGDARQTMLRDVRNADGLQTGQQVEYPVTVLSSSQRLNITLVWTEPAATSGASFASVNDLDLEVVGPGGVLYRGNFFMSGQSAQDGTRDDRNNVEQVQLQTPAAGAWTVRVKGTGVNVGRQGYAVVVSGDIPSSAGVNVVLSSTLPAAVPAGEALPVSVNITPGVDTIVPGSQRLFYRLDSGDFESVALTLDNGTRYVASVPGAGCGAQPEFYVSATGVATGVVTAPSGGAAEPFAYDIGVAGTAANEAFEVSDADWVGTWTGDTTSIGRWVRMDPIGTIAAPADDHTPGAGVNCWITGPESPFGGGQLADVDGGAVSLVSPAFDLSSASSAMVSYWRWYNNSTGANANADTFLVQVSNNNGSTWTTIETVGPGGMDTQGGWIFHQEDLAMWVPMTSQVRVRFVAQDLGADSTIEAGVDDFRLDVLACDSGCACDWNSSGELNSQDFFDFVASFFGGSADFNDDNETNSQDFFDFLGCFFGGC